MARLGAGLLPDPTLPVIADVEGREAYQRKSRSLRFRVYGIPVGQGSMKAFKSRKGKVVVTHQSSQTKPWREAIKWSAKQEMAIRVMGLMSGPLAVDLVFHLPKPRQHKLRTFKQREQWAFPWRRPDLDKLQRAAMDALTGVVIHDDAQVVTMGARKIYGDEPGLEVLVRELEP